MPVAGPWMYLESHRFPGLFVNYRPDVSVLHGWMEGQTPPLFKDCLPSQERHTSPKCAMQFLVVPCTASSGLSFDSAPFVCLSPQKNCCQVHQIVHLSLVLPHPAVGAARRDTILPRILVLAQQAGL